MSEPAPAGSVCWQHPESPAAWSCRRCGAFFCVTCERRTRPEALPMCPACWDLRAERVEKPAADKSGRLRVWGLILGLLALFPGCWILQVAAIVVNILGIRQGRKKKLPREGFNIAGLLLAIIGLLITIAIFVGARLTDL